MILSKHAQIRSQQRCIAPLIVDLLMQFGARECDGRGGEICYFDHRSKRQIQSYVGVSFEKIRKQLDAYIVVANETVITIGLRYKRINRK